MINLCHTKERPIIFSAPMVRAILDGRKTQTRRIVKWQGPRGFEHSFDHAEIDNPAGVKRLCVPYRHPDDSVIPWKDEQAHRHYCPYGDPGDRLWVRESLVAKDGFMVYAADGGRIDCGDTDWPACIERRHTIPSIHMPRWASRITLEVTGVRVERLQSISEADAMAEGIELRHGTYGTWNADETMRCGGSNDPREAFRCLWININGPRSWDQNPWVWVIEFRRVA